MRFLLDEMYPPSAAALLRERHGRDADHVTEVGLAGVDDADVAAVARQENRALVTENVVDFADERDVVLIFVPKNRLPSGGAMNAALADLLDRWATANPEPFIGPHWPT